MSDTLIPAPTTSPREAGDRADEVVVLPRPRRSPEHTGDRTAPEKAAGEKTPEEKALEEKALEEKAPEGAAGDGTTAAPEETQWLYPGVRYALERLPGVRRPG